MPLWRAYQGLSSRARLGVGLGLLAWGTVGLTWGDEIGKARKFLKFSDKDKAQLEKIAPKIVVVDRGRGSHETLPEQEENGSHAGARHAMIPREDV